MGGIFKVLVGVVEIVVGVVLTIYGGGSGIGLIISGISTLASGISEMSASKPAPKAGSVGGTSEQIAYDPTLSRRAIIGTGMAAGSIADVFTHDHLPAGGGNEGKNRVKEMIIALCDHEVDSLVEIWNGSAKLTLGTYDSTLGYAIPSYNSGGRDHLYIKFYTGTWDQAADAHLIAVSGGRWTSAAKGVGVCYARVTMVAAKDSDDTAWAGGQPQLKFIIKGAKLYDPRKDLTVGGSGAHRFDDLTTHEWSDNAAVAECNLIWGLRLPDGNLLYGVGAKFAQVRFGDAVAAMNACDELVALKAGGTEPRYRVGGQIDCSIEVRTTLNAIEQSMAGRTINVSGIWRVFAGVASSPVLEFTDTDIMPREQATAEPKFASDALINAVYGTYIDPASGYSLKALPVRRNADDIAEDGGIERKKDLQFDFVPFFTQCQRVQEIERRKGRCQMRFTRVTPPYMYVAEAGDWVAWTSARYSFSSKPFELLGTGITPKLDVQLTLAETNSAVYGWTAATDELPETGGDIPSADPPDALVPTGVVLTPGSQAGDGGSSVPVVGISWDAPNSSMVTGITFQYRAVADPGAVHSMTAIDVNDANAALRAMLLPDLEYEGRLKFNTASGVAATWTDWIPFTITTGFVLTAGADPMTERLLKALASAKPIRDEIADAVHFDWLDTLEAAVAAATANIADLVNLSGIVRDATIERLPDGTVHMRSLDALSATVNGVSASVSTVQDLVIDLQGRTQAYWQASVDVGTGQAYARIAADNVSTSILLVADLIGLVSPDDGSLIPALTVTGGNVYIANKIYIGTDLWIDRTVPGFVYNDGVVSLVLGGRFGASSNLVFWYGLAMDAADMTKTNGIVSFDTLGAAYFGGTLSIGILTTKAATPALGDDAVAETAFFGSLGGPIHVNLSYIYTSTSFFRYTGTSYTGSDSALDDLHADQVAKGYTAGNSSGTSSATIDLYRNINHGAYALATTLTVSGPWTMTVTHNPGSATDHIFQSWDVHFSIAYSGSLTYTDSAMLAQDRQFKAVINARDAGYWGSTATPTSQFIGIVCSEE